MAPCSGGSAAVLSNDDERTDGIGVAPRPLHGTTKKFLLRVWGDPGGLKYVSSQTLRRILRRSGHAVVKHGTVNQILAFLPEGYVTKWQAGDKLAGCFGFGNRSDCQVLEMTRRILRHRLDSERADLLVGRQRCSDGGKDMCASKPERGSAAVMWHDLEHFDGGWAAEAPGVAMGPEFELHDPILEMAEGAIPDFLEKLAVRWHDLEHFDGGWAAAAPGVAMGPALELYDPILEGAEGAIPDFLGQLAVRWHDLEHFDDGWAAEAPGAAMKPEFELYDPILERAEGAIPDMEFDQVWHKPGRGQGAAGSGVGVPTTFASVSGVGVPNALPTGSGVAAPGKSLAVWHDLEHFEGVAPGEFLVPGSVAQVTQVLHWPWPGQVNAAKVSDALCRCHQTCPGLVVASSGVDTPTTFVAGSGVGVPITFASGSGVGVPNALPTGSGVAASSKSLAVWHDFEHFDGVAPAEVPVPGSVAQVAQVLHWPWLGPVNAAKVSDALCRCHQTCPGLVVAGSGVGMPTTFVAGSGVGVPKALPTGSSFGGPGPIHVAWHDLEHFDGAFPDEALPSGLGAQDAQALHLPCSSQVAEACQGQVAVGSGGVPAAVAAVSGAGVPDVLPAGSGVAAPSLSYDVRQDPKRLADADQAPLTNSGAQVAQVLNMPCLGQLDAAKMSGCPCACQPCRGQVSLYATGESSPFHLAHHISCHPVGQEWSKDPSISSGIGLSDTYRPNHCSPLRPVSSFHDALGEAAGLDWSRDPSISDGEAKGSTSTLPPCPAPRARPLWVPLGTPVQRPVPDWPSVGLDPRTPFATCSEPGPQEPLSGPPKSTWRAGGGGDSSLSASLLESLKPMILKLVREAVEQALKQILGAPPSSPTTAPTCPPASTAAPKDARKKGKGDGAPKQDAPKPPILRPLARASRLESKPLPEATRAKQKGALRPPARAKARLPRQRAQRRRKVPKVKKAGQLLSASALLETFSWRRPIGMLPLSHMVTSLRLLTSKATRTL